MALGIARTGRVITAAALIMSISFAALIAAEVSFMRMFGLGLTLAVLADATLVRMVLVPAFMHVMGEWNWWAPGGWSGCTTASASTTVTVSPTGTTDRQPIRPRRSERTGGAHRVQGVSADQCYRRRPRRTTTAPLQPE